MTAPPATRTAPGFRRGPSRLALWAPLVAYMGMIFALSSTSRLPSLPAGMNDTVAHVLEYFGLGALLVRALARGTRAGVRPAALVGAILVAALLGLSDEAHQLFVPGREFDVRDLAADTLGAAGAAGAIWAWSIIRRFSGVQNERV